MAWPSSRIRFISWARLPASRPSLSRAKSSAWRSVPIRHGTHCPHDSWRKKWAIDSRSSARSTVSSKTITTPEPRVALAARTASKVSGMSSASGPTKTPAAPPSRIACRVRPGARPAGELEQRPHGDAERHLEKPRLRDRARDAEKLEPGRAFGAQRRPRRAAHREEQRHVGQGLDVVDHGRPAEEAELHRERRLRARLAAFAFDRVEQRGLFAADVGAAAPPQLELEAEAGGLGQGDRVAQEAGGPRLGHRRLEPADGQRIFPAHVEEAALGADRETGQGHRLDHREGSSSITKRSLKVPGSDSSALQTT